MRLAAFVRQSVPRDDDDVGNLFLASFDARSHAIWRGYALRALLRRVNDRDHNVGNSECVPFVA